MSERRFDGKRALVTGGASGIGLAIAERLAAEGATVGLVDLRADGLERAAARVRAAGAGAVLTYAVDVADAAACAAAVEAFAGAGGGGGIDITVTAAGFGHVAGVLEMTADEWRRMIDVHLNGTFHCAQAAAKAMVAQGRGGSVVMVASINAFAPGKGNAHYSSAKAGIANLARAMAFELGGNGIRVNALAPGVVRTPLASMLTEDAGLAAGYLKLTPLGRFGEPEDVAGAAAFLASADAAYVTGHLLVVDGGITAGIDFIPSP
jgi:NAD(P)-dependent dehydrogenase (short-subunit alcohol dehydrogenase family)